MAWVFMDLEMKPVDRQFRKQWDVCRQEVIEFGAVKLGEDLAEIDSLMTEYLGENANRFKRGIVYETDPDFADKVNITVIATGFEMKRLNEITNVKLGNIIEIDYGFTYKKGFGTGCECLEQSEVQSQKIGYNSASIKTTFDFTVKPSLLVGELDDKSELENRAAIRRKGKKDKTE